MAPTADQTLRLKILLDRQAGSLVNRAEAALPDQHMQSLKGKLTMAQISNLLGVALEAESPQVVRNWLLYTMGRKETRRGWVDERSGQQQQGLGVQVVKDIVGLRVPAEAIAKQVYSNDTNLADEIEAIHMALVRSYIGYLRRWFVAKGGQA